jgi:hypothetical protein
MAEPVAEPGVDELAPQISMFSKYTQEVNESIPVEREDQSLESHEVIELQTFSERKAWIEEKIRVGFLYTLMNQLLAHIFAVLRIFAAN